MSLTGGELNLLNGNQGISAPFRSVPVMKLIREHKPRTKNELVELIEYHYKNKCSCGIVAKALWKTLDGIFMSRRSGSGANTSTRSRNVKGGNTICLLPSL